jgi:hypothetical protein
MRGFLTRRRMKILLLVNKILLTAVPKKDIEEIKRALALGSFDERTYEDGELRNLLLNFLRIF